MIESRRAYALRLAAVSLVIGAFLAAAGTASTSAATPTGSQGLIEFWNGTSWTQQASPSNPAGSTYLESVAAVSPSDAWAFGSYAENTLAATPAAVAEHWNGVAWLPVSMPIPSGSSEVHLHAAAAVSANDVWAVGSYAGYTDGAEYAPLIEHWNGSAWSIVPSPVLPSPAVNNSGQLYGITALSANDIWAVGYVGFAYPRPLVLHWDGSSWKRVPAPRSGGYHPYSQLYSVSAISPSSIWAVGSCTCNQSGKPKSPHVAQMIALHWNGSAWKNMKSPGRGRLYATAAVGSNDVWAVGGITNGGTGRACALHWNGHKWQSTSVVTGSPVSVSQPLYSMAVLADDDVWAVGGHWDAHSLEAQTLSEHWDGAHWSTVPSVDASSNDDFAGLAATSPTAVWAVGTYYPGA